MFNAFVCTYGKYAKFFSGIIAVIGGVNLSTLEGHASLTSSDKLCEILIS